MKVLVAGAAGFSGRHLVAALASDPAIELATSTRADCDLGDAAAVRALLAAVRPRRIYHLAGGFTNRPDDDHRANVVTTENLLAAAAALGWPCRVLVVGSAAEYGAVAPADNPVAESHPLRPVSAYGAAKVRQTEVMRAFAGAGALEVVQARAFNLLGAGLSPRLVVGRVQAWLAGGARGRLVVGDLGGRRDYLPIAAALAGYRLVMERGAAGEIYNVGSGRPRLVREVVHALLAERGVDPAALEEAREPLAVGSSAADVWADTRKLDGLRAS